MGEQFIKRKGGLVAGADVEFVRGRESRGSQVLIAAGSVFVCVGELGNDRQGNILAAYKPLRDNNWVPRLHGYDRPQVGIGQHDRSPILTDVCEENELFGMFFTTVVNSETDNLRQKFGRKVVRRISPVQDVCYVQCCGFQCIVQLVDYRPDCVSGSMNSPISISRLTDLSWINLLPIEATTSLTESVIGAGGTVLDITACCRRGQGQG